MTGATTAVAAATVASAGINYLGSQQAADTQANAANKATNLQEQIFDTTQQNFAPYLQGGATANNALLALTGLSPYTASGTGTGTGATPSQIAAGGSGNILNSSLLGAPTANLSAADLAKTPGYQFDLSQGLESTQNSAAARGLGVSGAALKGASAYATGLAQNTYQQQYQNQVTNQTNQFNRLSSLTGLGQASAASQAVQGTQTGANIGNNITGAANAQAASTIAGVNGVNNAINTGLGYNYLNSLQSQNQFANNGGVGSVNASNTAGGGGAITGNYADSFAPLEG